MHDVIIGTRWIGAVRLVDVRWLYGFLATRCGQGLVGCLRLESWRLLEHHRVGVLVYICARHASHLLLLRPTCGLRGMSGSVDYYGVVDAVFVSCDGVRAYREEMEWAGWEVQKFVVCRV